MTNHSIGSCQEYYMSPCPYSMVICKTLQKEEDIQLVKKITVFMALILFAALSAYALEPIQTQPSTDGKMEASIIGAKVRSNVLTLKVDLKATSGNDVKVIFLYQDIYVTDLNEKKKYLALKDADGLYIAGPKHDNERGGRFWETIPTGEKRTVWIKFPAPPEVTEVVDVFIPGILPFEDVALTR
ncbi:MAG TPA: hypothetical protein PKZ42_00825 [Syntrophales bacterium]|nr:hypothetical protein [Syntrophales bacterium]